MKLELRDVRHVYARGTPFQVEALRGVSLVVEPGEVLAIVGGTGSGKSTLVQHMNLLLVPTSGEVLVDGVDATTLKKSELQAQGRPRLPVPRIGALRPDRRGGRGLRPTSARAWRRGGQGAGARVAAGAGG